MADLNADRWMADRDRAQRALQAEVDRVFVPDCLANVNNTVDVLAPVVADLIRQAREVTPAGDEYDPRTEVAAHWGGDPEQLIGAWEADQAQWRARVKELGAALIGCGKPTADDGPPPDLPDWAEREKQAADAGLSEQG